MGLYEAFHGQAPKRKNAAGHSQSEEIKSFSHYNDNILHGTGRPAGRSRGWGDADEGVQETVIDALISASKAHGLDKHDAALVLAIVRHESGFNPDAANKASSAASLGQFIDKTGEKYGLNAQNRFDVLANADAVVRYFMACREKAQKVAKESGIPDAERDRWVYKFYHDGLYSDRKDSGGLGIFDKANGIKEWIPRIQGAIDRPYEKARPADSVLTLPRKAPPVGTSRPLKKSGLPINTPLPAPLRLWNPLDSIGRGISNTLGSVRNWLYPEPAPQRAVLPSPGRPISPGAPSTRPSPEQATASRVAPPSPQRALPVNFLGPSPFPLYTGSPRPVVQNGQIPVGIGLGPYASQPDTRIRFDLPGTVGAGEWLRNELSPGIPFSGTSPAATPYRGDAAPGFPGPLPSSFERGFGTGPEVQIDQSYGMFLHPGRPSSDAGETEDLSSERVLRKFNRLAGANGLPWPRLS
jgi:hypothetical protein